MAALARERDGDEPPRRDAGERVLTRLRRADEQRELRLLVARGEVRIAVEDEDRGALVPGQLFLGDAELVVRHSRHVDARALDVDAAGAPDADLQREGVGLVVDRSG